MSSNEGGAPLVKRRNSAQIGSIPVILGRDRQSMWQPIWSRGEYLNRDRPRNSRTPNMDCQPVGVLGQTAPYIGRQQLILSGQLSLSGHKLPNASRCLHRYSQITCLFQVAHTRGYAVTAHQRVQNLPEQTPHRDITARRCAHRVAARDHA